MCVRFQVSSCSFFNLKRNFTIFTYPLFTGCGVLTEEKNVYYDKYALLLSVTRFVCLDFQMTFMIVFWFV